MSVEKWSDLLFSGGAGRDSHVYGSVESVNADGSYEVRLNASGVTARCAACCTASAGDRVLVVVKADGKCAAIGRVGGEAAGSGGGAGVPSGGTDGQLLAKDGTADYAAKWVDPPSSLPSNKVLWSGAWYMTASQTATLSEAVSAQRHGIVLVFSAYSSSMERNYNFNCFFVPKSQVSSHSGCGHNFPMATTKFGTIGNKYLYISDTGITGLADNTHTESSSQGLITKIGNDSWVLRHVIGV